MKKISLVLLFLIIAGTASFADSTSLSLSYTTDTYVYQDDSSLSSSAVSLSFGAFSGEFLGFYTNTSIGMPVSFSISGYDSTESIEDTYDNIRVSLNSVNCLALELPLGNLNLMAGAGIGITSLLLVPSDLYNDPLLFFVVGPAAYAEISFEFGGGFGIMAGAKVMYGMYDLMGNESFMNSFMFEPSIGLSFH